MVKDQKESIIPGQKLTAVIKKDRYQESKIWFTPKVEQIKQLLPKMTPLYGNQLPAEVEYDDGSTKNVVVRIVGCLASNNEELPQSPCDIFPPPA